MKSFGPFAYALVGFSGEKYLSRFVKKKLSISFICDPILTPLTEFSLFTWVFSFEKKQYYNLCFRWTTIIRLFSTLPTIFVWNELTVFYLKLFNQFSQFFLSAFFTFFGCFFFLILIDQMCEYKLFKKIWWFQFFLHDFNFLNLFRWIIKRIKENNLIKNDPECK